MAKWMEICNKNVLDSWRKMLIYTKYQSEAWIKLVNSGWRTWEILGNEVAIMINKDFIGVSLKNENEWENEWIKTAKQ